MKSAIYLFIALLLVGCSKTEIASENPIIFTSIQPQVGLLKKMVNDSVEVHALVSDGQSPHAYEPTPNQLTKLGKADILFTIGLPFEKSLLKKVKSLYPDLEIVETDHAITKRSIHHSSLCKSCSTDHEAPDPHLWLSPKNAIQIATCMFNELGCGVADKVAFESLILTLKNMDEEFSKNLAPYKGRQFYVFHPSFGYFADAYGLKQVSIELDGKSPTPRQTTKLIEQAKSDGVQVIFVQKQFPVNTAKVIAEAIDGSVIQLDPLAEDLLENLHQIANNIEATFSTYNE